MRATIQNAVGIARRQVSIMKNPPPGQVPDISLLNGVVADRILEAMAAASKQLQAAGVRHALVGGLAVGAWGHPRATKDVDFLVGEEAFQHHEGGLVMMAPGVPIQVAGVPVDPISMSGGESCLEDAVAHPIASHAIPVAPLEALVYLKLKSPRMKDSADVVEVLKAIGDRAEVREYLRRNAPGLLAKYEALVEEAESEE